MQSSLFGSESEEIVVRRLTRRLDRYLKSWEQLQTKETSGAKNLTPPPLPIASSAHSSKSAAMVDEATAITLPSKPKLSVVPPPIPSSSSSAKANAFEPQQEVVVQNVSEAAETSKNASDVASRISTKAAELSASVEIPEANQFLNSNAPLSKTKISANPPTLQKASQDTSSNAKAHNPQAKQSDTFASAQKKEYSKPTLAPPIVAMASEFESVAETIARQNQKNEARSPNIEPNTILGMRPVFAYLIVFICAVLVVLYFVLASEHFAY